MKYVWSDFKHVASVHYKIIFDHFLPYWLIQSQYPISRKWHKLYVKWSIQSTLPTCTVKVSKLIEASENHASTTTILIYLPQLFKTKRSWLTGIQSCIGLELQCLQKYGEQYHEKKDLFLAWRIVVDSIWALLNICISFSCFEFLFGNAGYCEVDQRLRV